MKVFIILFLVSGCAFAQEFREGKRAVLRPSTRATCNGRVSVCDGCFNLQICAITSISLPCGDAKPFCVNKDGYSECSAQSDANADDCKLLPSTFVCTSKGYFPNPSECKSYYYCAAEASAPEPFSCYDEGYIFNEAVTSPRDACKRGTERDCTTITCDSSKLGFIAYGKLNKYYAFCYKTAVDDTRFKVGVLQCEKGATFNQTQQRCIYRCPGVGMWPYSFDDKKYYKCYFLNRVLTAVVETCPSGQKFDERIRNCVVV